MSSNKNNVNRIPQDELAMRAILKDMGITEYERRVVQQMLEFTYRYTTEILEEARVYSNHSKTTTSHNKSSHSSKGIDIDDIKLAIQNYGDRSGRAPPRIDLLNELARNKNQQPLPQIKSFTGPRIPPDRYCLSGINFRAKEATSHSRSESFEDAKPENDSMDIDTF